MTALQPVDIKLCTSVNSLVASCLRNRRLLAVTLNYELRSFNVVEPAWYSALSHLPALLCRQFSSFLRIGLGTNKS